MTGQRECAAAASILDGGAARLGLALTHDQRSDFITYCSLLDEAGRATNLTGARSPDAIMRTLFLDSLTLLLALPDWARSGPCCVVDVGSGAGVPGMPLKLMCPSWELTVVESVAKKAAFLDRLHVELKVTGVSIANTRAEDLARDPDHRERMDVATARAVASLASLIELCAPLVRSGGLLLFPKSGTVEAEVDAAQEAARRLGARLASVVPIPDALGLGSGRSIVVYERHGSVPPGYPRRTGLAQSRPIGT